MDKYMYPSLKARIQAEYKIYLLAFLFIAIADKIGQIKIPFGLGTFILFPIFYSLILGILSGPQVAKIVKSKEVKAASKLVIVAICPFIAKLGINAGASIETVISAGPALLLQEFGNLGTIFLAMPLALMLGLKREVIGATHSINRETNLALITDMYGPDSPETRGSLSIYVVGGMIGTLLRLHGFHYRFLKHFPSLCPGHVLRCGRRHHDGQRNCCPHRDLSGYGRSDFCTGQRQRDHLRHRWHLHGDLYRHPAVQLAVRKAGAGPWPQKQQERKQNQRIISGGTNQYEIH